MKTALDPMDILEFQFKQLSHLKISDGFESVPPACSLLAVDGKRGLLYTACDNKITVLKSGDSSDKDWKREYVLPAKVTRLALNCDCSFLAVTLHHPTTYVYNAASFSQQTLELLHEIKLSSTENVYVLDLRWNPCIPGALCTITSDYTVGSFNITADKPSAIPTILEKLEKLEVLCVAWSPKGKQFVVGCKNGNLLQLKPDLKVARNIAGPNPSIGSIIALLWISNYQFCAAYLDPQNSRINVLIIDAPKGEANATFTCYEDITYGLPGVEGEEGGPRYYFEHISEWGLIVAASSGSCEVAVLGSQDNGANWKQWQLVDSGRAQLPLVRTSESYPVGLAVDRTSVHKLPWGGEGSTIPHPVPILHILGTSGQLCRFHMINLMPGIPGICCPPTEIIPPPNQPRLSLAPTEISFNLIGGITSTPRPKQIDTTQDRTKSITTATTRLFADTARATVPPPQVELNVPKPQVQDIEAMSKVDTIVLPSKEVNQQEIIGIDSNTCIRAYQEEYNLFEKELKSRREIQTVDIGSAAERNELIEKSEAMDRFLMLLQETTVSLTNDISDLKALLLQTFAWLEEAKSRCSSDTSNNPQHHGDNNRLKEFERRMYYAQSQLEQAIRVLDHEWLEHINKEKSKMKVPKLEFVYQNMLRHSQIIAEEKNIIQTLVKKWKALTRGYITSSLNKSMANMSLLSFTSPGIINTNIAIEQRCKTIAIRTCSFSREKQCKLRNLLIQSPTKIIKAPTLSPIQDRLQATLSFLATQSPPKQVHEDKTKSKSDPKLEIGIAPALSLVQPARNPLASLDEIVANIGSIGTQRNINAQNKAPTSSAASVPTQVIQIPQVDGQARAAAALTTPQTPISTQARQNRPLSVSLFGTPQTPQPASAIPSGIKSIAISEVSPFTSTASKTLASQSLPAALIPTPQIPNLASEVSSGITPVAISVVPPFTSTAPKTSAPQSIPVVPIPTVSSISKPLAKIDTIPFSSAPIKADVPPLLPVSTGISLAISSSMIPAAIAPTPPPPTNEQTSFSFSSPAHPPTSQVTSFSNTLKTPSTTVTITAMSTKTSPLQSFSFASKPASSTAFSFASRPTTSPPSNAAQSLDLSAMGLDLQAPSNTPVENLTPTTTVAGNSFFGPTASPSSGPIFGGRAVTAKDKIPGTIFGNPGFSSIFGGSNASGNTGSPFGGDVMTSSVMPRMVFGSATASTPASIFGGSAASPVESVAAETPAVSSTGSGFENSVNSSSLSTSVFGNISSTANSPSIFGGNSAPILNASALGGTNTSPVQVFGETTTSPIKPSIFGGDSSFGKPPDSKPSVFGGAPTSTAPLSPFGSSSTGSSNTPIFGGTVSTSPAVSTFESTTPNPTTASVFGTIPSVSSNQSIFAGAVSSTPATNIETTLPTPTAAIPAFGQTATFGAKPDFGTIFGASKPIFGGGFANTVFPVASQQTSGFGGFNTTPPLGGNIPAMSGGSIQKVFGESSGSSTFGNLAAQEGGLTFGNLAQKQAEPAPPPAFSGKSSFSSWR